MIYDLQIINSNAQLNNFFQTGSAQFSPGIPLKINMRLFQRELNLRYVPTAGATYSMEFKLSDQTTITKVPVEIDPLDRSLITVSLTAAETQTLIGQDLKLVITEGLNVSVAIVQRGLQAVRTDC